MPFNVSNPVLYYLKPLFEDAGLDPADPPVSLEELRAASQAIVDSGAAGTGIALDSGVDSGGGWFLEQWFARMQRAVRRQRQRPAGAGDAGALRRPGRRRADDRGAVADHRRAGRDGRRQPERPGRLPQAGRPGEPGGDDDRHVGGAGHGPRRARRRADRRPHQRRPRRRSDAGARRDAVGGAGWRVAVHRRREGRREGGGGVGLHPVRHERPVAVDVGGGDGVRADPRGRHRARPAEDEVRHRPAVRGGLRPDARRRRRPRRRWRRRSARCVEVRSTTAGAVAAIFGGADPATSLAAAAQQSNALLADYNARN